MQFRSRSVEVEQDQGNAMREVNSQNRVQINTGVSATFSEDDVVFGMGVNEDQEFREEGEIPMDANEEERSPVEAGNGATNNNATNVMGRQDLSGSSSNQHALNADNRKGNMEFEGFMESAVRNEKFMESLASYMQKNGFIQRPVSAAEGRASGNHAIEEVVTVPVDLGTEKRHHGDEGQQPRSRQPAKRSQEIMNRKQDSGTSNGRGIELRFKPGNGEKVIDSVSDLTIYKRAVALSIEGMNDDQIDQSREQSKRDSNSSEELINTSDETVNNEGDFVVAEKRGRMTMDE